MRNINLPSASSNQWNTKCYSQFLIIKNYTSVMKCGFFRRFTYLRGMHYSSIFQFSSVTRYNLGCYIFWFRCWSNGGHWVKSFSASIQTEIFFFYKFMLKCFNTPQSSYSEFKRRKYNVLWVSLILKLPRANGEKCRFPLMVGPTVRCMV